MNIVKLSKGVYWIPKIGRHERGSPSKREGDPIL